jgi:toxin ParE1/3/4
MKEISFHSEAAQEMYAAAVYYEMRQENLGKRFLSAVQDGVVRIRFNPLLFPMLNGQVRRCSLRIFPYGIIFREKESYIDALAKSKKIVLRHASTSSARTDFQAVT